MVDGDSRAFRGERQRDLAPDVAGSARNQSNAVLELHFHGCAFQVTEASRAGPCIR